MSYNDKLKGYIPEPPKIDICDYYRTNLCTLKSNKCKKGIDNSCTLEIIKESNYSNGNPDPSSTEYNNDIEPPKGRHGLAPFNPLYIFAVGAAVIISIYLCCCLSACCCGIAAVRDSNDEKEQV